MNMQLRRALIVMAVSACALPALAAGGGGGGGGGDTTAASSDPDFRAGVAAAKAKDWATVTTRMQVVVQRDPKNADAWNELGHAARMSGDMDNSFRHYQKALEIDPKHRDAREYLGEAYLQVGNLEAAEQQLRALDKLCFLPCEQFSDLKEQIRRYRAEHPQAAKS